MSDIKVVSHRIIGTDMVVFGAYEPSSYMGPHSTLFTIEDQVHGQIGSRRLPEDLDTLPARSEKRSKAVNAWHEAQYQEAYDAILAEHPEAAKGSRRMGEIVIHTKEAVIA